MDRLTAEAALAHPFLQQYSCPEDEPTSSHPFRIEDELEDSLVAEQSLSNSNCQVSSINWERCARLVFSMQYCGSSWLSHVLFGVLNWQTQNVWGEGPEWLGSTCCTLWGVVFVLLQVRKQSIHRCVLAAVRQQLSLDAPRPCLLWPGRHHRGRGGPERPTGEFSLATRGSSGLTCFVVYFLPETDRFERISSQS